MDVEYKELKSKSDIDQCIELQKSIFDLSDVDLISPLLLKLIARNDPPIGISLGVFYKNKLIGFIIGMASFFEKSIYVLMMGMHHSYQNKTYGFGLLKRMRDLSISNNLNYMYCIYDPLEANLARLYYICFGCLGIKYIKDAYFYSHDTILKSIPNDTLVVRWDLKATRTVERVEKGEIKKSLHIEFPIASFDYLTYPPKVLVEIPENFNQLKETDYESAFHWREKTRKIFTEYINNKNYIISDCISTKINNKRKTYYLMEEQK
jgi:predicted GNAT superfamily acetyltransferase